MAGAARQRFHLDLDVCELAVPTALPLEGRVLRRGPADGLAVADLRAVSLRGQAVLRAQPVERDLQVDVALAPEHELVAVLAVLKLEGRVLLDHPLDRAR